LFSYAVARWPVLKPAAYVLILNIGIQLIVEQLWRVELSDLTRFVISVAIILGALAYARSSILQRFKPVLMGLSFIMGAVNKVVDLSLFPFKALFQWTMNRFKISKAEGAK
jgi:tellurite resistance protein TerC